MRLRAWHESQDVQSHRVFNLGVGGDGVLELLDRGPREAAVRRPDLILLYPGLNDTRRIRDAKAPPQTAPEVVEAQLRILLTELKSWAPVAMMSAVPVDESRTSPFWGKWFFTQEDAAQMTQIVSRCAEATGTLYLPLFERWNIRPDMPALLADGLHCNAKGHEMLFNEVRDFLQLHHF